MRKETPRNEDINYLHGQIAGLRQLLLAVAEMSMSRDEFLSQGLLKLESAKIAGLGFPIHDNFLSGLDTTELWLKQVCGEPPSQP